METDALTINNLFSLFGARLSALYPQGEVRQMLYILFGEYLGMSKTDIHLAYNDLMADETIARFEKALSALESGIPLQYITGVAEFNGKRLNVNPHVLIPRPETEELCILAYAGMLERELVPKSVLDIGTGSGCIAIDMKSRFPEASVTAVDISTEALAVAAGNAGQLGLDIQIRRADILDPDSMKGLNGPFSLILSNPPYVTLSEKELIHANVKDHEPELALFVPDSDPLIYYRALYNYASLNLEPGGRLYLEINSRFGEAMVGLGLACGLVDVRLHRDIHEKDRFISASRQG